MEKKVIKKRTRVSESEKIEARIHQVVKNTPGYVIVGSGLNFVVLSKFVTLKVVHNINNSVFQPYETTESKGYCLLSIVEWGKLDKPLRVIDDLKATGCPVYKINFVESVNDILRKT